MIDDNNNNNKTVPADITAKREQAMKDKGAHGIKRIENACHWTSSR